MADEPLQWSEFTFPKVIIQTQKEGRNKSQSKHLTTLKGIPRVFLRWALMSTHPLLKIARCGQWDGEKWWMWKAKQTFSCNTGILQGLKSHQSHFKKYTSSLYSVQSLWMWLQLYKCGFIFYIGKKKKGQQSNYIYNNIQNPQVAWETVPWDLVLTDMGPSCP